MVLWVDELYIKPEYRGCGLGHAFFAFLEKSPHVKRIRLEVESRNERAIALYRRLGYTDLPYSQMMKDL
ncbi:hypothetical protein SDC9_115799 [bioreactor metagenome]|uniref:N-acetyltransferase domain-containing protein n=1 Tax=bioreactor metagenome TaxID=1076179 RepID=A0A645C4I3_9ZZZZ